MEDIKIKIYKLLQNFKSVKLNEMHGVSLMKRIDTKFVVPVNKILEILPFLTDDYKALEVNNDKFQEYNTQYFDTNDFKFYHDHHSGKILRKKVRIRKYLTSGDSFLEIKRKTSKGITKKLRIAVDDIKSVLDKKELDFAHEHLGKKTDLFATIRNRFNRITLVNEKSNERLTLDFGLKLFYKNLSWQYDNIAIIELKQVKINRQSRAFSIIERNNIHPFRVSKYCVGMAKLIPKVKSNNFKHKLLKIEALNKPENFI